MISIKKIRDFFFTRQKLSPALKPWLNCFLRIALCSLLLVIVGLLIFLFLHNPPPGYSVAAVGLLAILMSFYPNLNKHTLKFAMWMFLLVVLTYIELQAIQKDRSDSQKTFETAQNEQRASFSNLLTHEGKQFELARKQQLETVGQIARGAQANQTEFQRLLKAQQVVTGQQQNFLNFVTGKLQPREHEVPQIRRCSSNSSQAILRIGRWKNQTTVDRFPFAFFLERMIPVATIDLGKDNLLFLKLDLRSEDGKTMLKLDENGIRHSKEVLVSRPDPSTLIIEDSFGKELFRADYIDPRTMAVTGQATSSSGKTIEFELGEEYSHDCFSNQPTNIDAKGRRTQVYYQE